MSVECVPSVQRSETVCGLAPPINKAYFLSRILNAMKMKACVERAGGEPRVRACAAGPGDIVRAELINDKVKLYRMFCVLRFALHLLTSQPRARLPILYSMNVGPDSVRTF